ncbi:MAG: RDD family protein [Chroococcidiopsidaceae cyanobacterium CP_BM_ER_R8_30]|nr:RDD family protein [Chroococcidiopsidaceae cyanobacterium CP_BM_ER_R8_30]
MLKTNKSTLVRVPKVQLWRRSVAFLIDFICTWILSVLLGSQSPTVYVAQAFVFAVIWLSLRVLLAYWNQGQSLGRWLLNLRMLDAQLKGVIYLPDLARREVVTGFGTLLVLIALSDIQISNFVAFLLLIPLAIDCGFIFLDRQRPRALHDRLAGTVIVATHRGFSLDLKIKRLFASIRGFVGA